MSEGIDMSLVLCEVDHHWFEQFERAGWFRQRRLLAQKAKDWIYSSEYLHLPRDERHGRVWVWQRAWRMALTAEVRT